MTNCRPGRRATSTDPPFVRTAEPLEQGYAKATFIGSAGGQRNGVDLVLKDIVLGVHGGMTGPGSSATNGASLAADHTPMYLKPSKSILTPWPDLRPRSVSVEPGVSVNMMASLSKLRCVMGSTSELSGAL